MNSGEEEQTKSSKLLDLVNQLHRVVEEGLPESLFELKDSNADFHQKVIDWFKQIPDPTAIRFPMFIFEQTQTLEKDRELLKFASRCLKRTIMEIEKDLQCALSEEKNNPKRVTEDDFDSQSTQGQQYERDLLEIAAVMEQHNFAPAGSATLKSHVCSGEIVQMVKRMSRMFRLTCGDGPMKDASVGTDISDPDSILDLVLPPGDVICEQADESMIVVNSDFPAVSSFSETHHCPLLPDRDTPEVEMTQCMELVGELEKVAGFIPHSEDSLPERMRAVIRFIEGPYSITATSSLSTQLAEKTQELNNVQRELLDAQELLNDTIAAYSATPAVTKLDDNSPEPVSTALTAELPTVPIPVIEGATSEGLGAVIEMLEASQALAHQYHGYLLDIAVVLSHHNFTPVGPKAHRDLVQTGEIVPLVGRVCAMLDPVGNDAAAAHNVLLHKTYAGKRANSLNAQIHPVDPVTPATEPVTNKKAASYFTTNIKSVSFQDTSSPERNYKIGADYLSMGGNQSRWFPPAATGLESSPTRPFRTAASAGGNALTSWASAQPAVTPSPTRFAGQHKAATTTASRDTTTSPDRLTTLIKKSYFEQMEEEWYASKSPTLADRATRTGCTEKVGIRRPPSPMRYPSSDAATTSLAAKSATYMTPGYAHTVLSAPPVATTATINSIATIYSPTTATAPTTATGTAANNAVEDIMSLTGDVSNDESVDTDNGYVRA